MTGQTLVGYAAEREVELWRMAARAPCGSMTWRRCEHGAPEEGPPYLSAYRWRKPGAAWAVMRNICRGVLPVPTRDGCCSAARTETATPTHGRCA